MHRVDFFQDKQHRTPAKGSPKRRFPYTAILRVKVYCYLTMFCDPHKRSKAVFMLACKERLLQDNETPSQAFINGDLCNGRAIMNARQHLPTSSTLFIFGSFVVFLFRILTKDKHATGSRPRLSSAAMELPFPQHLNMLQKIQVSPRFRTRISNPSRKRFGCGFCGSTHVRWQQSTTRVLKEEQFVKRQGEFTENVSNLFAGTQVSYPLSCCYDLLELLLQLTLSKRFNGTARSKELPNPNSRSLFGNQYKFPLQSKNEV